MSGGVGPGAARARVDDADAGEEALEWRRFSRLDFVRVGVRILFFPLALAWIAFQELAADDAVELRDVLTFLTGVSGIWLWIAAGLLLLVVLATFVFEWLVWRRTSYALGRSGVHHRRGGLSRTRVDLPYARIHTVETERSLIDRLLGLGTVKVDTGADSSEAMALGRLRIDECARLRGELLSLAARARAAGPGAFVGEAAESWGTRRDGEAGAPDAPEAGEAYGRSVERVGGEEELAIYRLAPRDLVLARVFSGESVIGALAVVSGAVGAFFTDGISLLAVVAGLIGIAQSVGRSLSSQWGTRLSVAPTGVRMRAGLATTTTRTIAPMRVHLIEIRQSLVMRLLGRYSLSVTYPGMDSEEGEPQLEIVPLGRREDVEWVLWAFAHTLGVPEPARLVEQFLGEKKRTAPGELGRVEGVRFFAPMSSRARRLRPFSWRWAAIAYTDEVAMTRRRTLFSTRWAVLLHEHWQSVASSTSPIGRRLGVADVRFALVAGRLSISHLEAAEAERAVALAVRFSAERRAAGEAESIGQWRRRVGLGSASA